MKIEMEFHCPRCGSSHFGSVTERGGAIVSRHCNGAALKTLDDGTVTPVQCRYTWKREDDWKHFRRVQRFMTPEEFRANGGWS